MVVFKLPAAAEPPVASVTLGFGPLIQDGPSSVGLARVGQCRYQGLAGGDVVGMFGQQRLERTHDRRSTGVGRAGLGRDPLPEGNLSVHVAAIGVDPSPERVTNQGIGKIGQKPQSQLAEQRASRLGTNLVIGSPTQPLGFERAILDAKDLKQEPPGLNLGWIGLDRPFEARFGLRRAGECQRSPCLAQVRVQLRGRSGVDGPPVLPRGGPVAGPGRGLGLTLKPRGRLHARPRDQSKAEQPADSRQCRQQPP